MRKVMVENSFFPPLVSLVCCSEIFPSKQRLQDMILFVILMSRVVAAEPPGPRGESPGWEAMEQRQRSLSPFSRGVCHLLIYRFLQALAKRS